MTKGCTHTPNFHFLSGPHRSAHPRSTNNQPDLTYPTPPLEPRGIVLSQHKSIACYYNIVGALYFSYLTNVKASWGTFTGRKGRHRTWMIFGLVGVLATILITHPNTTDKATFTAELTNTLPFYSSMTGLFLIWIITAFAVLALTYRHFDLTMVLAIVVQVAPYVFYVLGTKRAQQGRQNQT